MIESNIETFRDLYTEAFNKVMYESLNSHNSGYFTKNNISINESEFYFMVLAAGKDRLVCDFVKLVMDSNNIANPYQYMTDIIIHKHCNKWDKILENLNAEYSAFDLTKKQYTAHTITDNDVTTNFDLFANESLNSQVLANDKENRSENDIEITSNNSVTSYEKINFTEALKNFIEASKINIIDIIIDDIYDMCTLNIM